MIAFFSEVDLEFLLKRCVNQQERKGPPHWIRTGRGEWKTALSRALGLERPGFREQNGSKELRSLPPGSLLRQKIPTQGRVLSACEGAAVITLTLRAILRHKKTISAAKRFITETCRLPFTL